MPEFKGSTGLSSVPGHQTCCKVEHSLRHMLGDKGSYSNMLGLMAAAPRHVRIAVKDKAKVNTGS